MATNARTTNQGIDPRPNYFALGVDETGAHHCYCTKTDTVHVIVDAERQHIQELGEKIVDEWMGFIDARRGWRSRRYGRSLAEKLVEGLEGE